MSVHLEKRRILGVLAGGDFPIRRLVAWAESAAVIVAADGGANRLYRGGIVPDAVVGDLDSIRPEVLALQKHVQREPDQDRTDCDKLLAYFQSAGVTAATVVGVEGNLLDHTIAAVHSALRTPLDVRFVLRKGFAWPIADGQVRRVSVEVSARVSLIPLSNCSAASLSGVKWPFRDCPLAATTFSSVSNRAAEPIVEASVRGGSALLFVQSEPRPTWP